MEQYNVVVIGSEEAFGNARAYMQKFMPFKDSGEPDGWVLSRENLKYIGDCMVLKTLTWSIAKNAVGCLRNLRGTVAVLEPTVSELEEEIKESVI